VFHWPILFAVCLAEVAAFAQQRFHPGLTAELRDSSGAIRIIMPSPHFQLDAGESLHPFLSPAFSAEWRGFVLVTRAGSYQFDGAAAVIALNGRTLSKETAVRLAAGRHPVTIRFERSPGAAAQRILWRSETFQWEPIPAQAFSHDDAQAPTGRDLQIEHGRELAETFGCINCHHAGQWKSAGPDLTGIGSRTSAAWIYAWLSDPQSFRSRARMPVMLDGAGRADVTAFLASLVSKDAAAPLRRRSSEVDIGKGSELTGTVGCLACHGEPQWKLQWLGSKYNLPALAAYLRDPSKVEPSGAMPSMQLNEADSMAIAAHLAVSRNPEFERTPPPGDAARGRQLVESRGCLGCHALSGQNNQHRAPELAALSTGGCLSPQPDGRLPQFRLTATEREALTAFLAFYRTRPSQSPAPIHRLRQTLVSLRCIACHRTDAGGPTATLAESVPSLAGAGEKLTTGWIEGVLSAGKRLRSGHELRMPHYTAAQTQSWPRDFAKAEGFDPGLPSTSPSVTSLHRETGLGLLGTNASRQGLGCIGCHDWGENHSLGEEGPQLINAGSRLRWDWYERWMLDPARILSGTSMPAYFRTMERGRARERILSLWAAMSIGPGAPAPEGYRAAEAELGGEAKPVPGKEAIVIRWDMPEATPAAIAVGLPGGRLSYCFDAGESRLRYAWQGGFLDLSGTLLRKTDRNRLTPTAELMGQVFYREAAFPIRIGAVDHIPQRRFRGYRIVDAVPEFHYQIGAMQVYEKLVADGVAIRRTLRLKPVSGNVWFVPEGSPPRSVPPSPEAVLEQVLRP
jgi:cbb3-type cytochrome oxidase cytochrome c subunit/cytochrome c553